MTPLQFAAENGHSGVDNFAFPAYNFPIFYKKTVLPHSALLRYGFWLKEFKCFEILCFQMGVFKTGVTVASGQWVSVWFYWIYSNFRIKQSWKSEKCLLLSFSRPIFESNLQFWSDTTSHGYK